MRIGYLSHCAYLHRFTCENTVRYGISALISENEYQSFSLRCFHLTVIAVSILTFSLSAQSVYPLHEIDLNALRGKNLTNGLRIKDFVLDQTRNLAYINYELTPNLHMADIGTAQLVKDLDYPDSLEGFTFIGINPLTWMLLTRSADDDTKLVGFNPMNPKFGAATPLTKSLNDMALDVAGNVVFISDGSDSIRILDGTSLRPIAAFNSLGIPRGVMALDSANRELLVVSAGPTNGRTSLAIHYSKSPYHVTRNLAFRIDEPIRKILLDTKNRRFMLVSEKRIYLFHQSGTFEREIEFQNGIADAAFCNRSGRLFLLDAGGHDWNGSHGVRGLIHIVVPLTGVRDSLIIGWGVKRLAMHQLTSQLVLASADENKLLLLDSQTLQQRGEVDPGESIDAIVFNPMHDELILANAFGEGNGLHRYRYRDAALDDMPAGYWTSCIVQASSENKIIVLEHLQSRLSIYPEFGTIPLVQIPLPGIPEARQTQLGSAQYDPESGTLLILIPEFLYHAIVDVKKLEVLHYGFVEGPFVKTPMGQPQFEGAVLRNKNSYAIVNRYRKELTIHDLRNGIMQKRFDLSSLNWENVGAGLTKILFYDEERGEIFIGPYRIEPFSDGLLQNPLSNTHAVFGILPSRRRYLCAAMMNDRITLNVVDRSSNSLIASLSLEGSFDSPVIHLYDSTTSRLFLAESWRATVRDYRIKEGPVGIEDDVPFENSPGVIDVFPQPVPRYGTLNIQLDLADDLDGIVETVDVLGRSLVRTRFVRQGNVSIPIGGMPPGLYRFTVRTKSGHRTGTFIVCPD